MVVRASCARLHASCPRLRASCARSRASCVRLRASCARLDSVMLYLYIFVTFDILLLSTFCHFQRFVFQHFVTIDVLTFNILSFDVLSFDILYVYRYSQPRKLCHCEIHMEGVCLRKSQLPPRIPGGSGWVLPAAAADLCWSRGPEIVLDFSTFPDLHL